MSRERAIAKQPAAERRPPVRAASPARPAAGAAQALQRRLGNQGAQALFAKPAQAATPAAAPAAAAKPPAAASTPAAARPAPPPPEAPKAQEAQAAPAAKLSPKSPKDDPAFQAVLAQTRHAKQGQRKHAEPQDKKREVVGAARLDVQDQAAYNDRKQHLETIDRTAAGNKDAKKHFTAAQFKTLLDQHLQTLEGNLPRDEAGAKRFKREKPLETIKNDLQGQVAEQNKQVAAPISAETGRPEPPKSNIEPIAPKPLVEEKPGAKPALFNAAAAAPKPLDDSEISLEEQSRSLDELMAKNKMTEEQLADSNEPKFLKALGSKKDAQAQAAAAPARYRAKEQAMLAKARQSAKAQGGAGYGGMANARGAAFAGVFVGQVLAETNDKLKQIAVKAELQRIYTGTKKAVEDLFTQLGQYVDETFNDESQKAKDAFEKRVEGQLDDIHGLGIKDFFFGEDTEAIEEVFAREKALFLAAMDRTLDKIATRIANDLNKAVERIQQGRQEAETFYQGLDKEQQKLAADAMDSFREQYANLESSVDEKQAELAQSLAASYKQNRDGLRAGFDKINEEVKKHWWERAWDYIKEVAAAIYRLGELLLNVLVRVASLIGDIIAHPIRFLENLGAGIKQGFGAFVADIDRYLVSGFFDWLKGKVGGAGIKPPAKFDTAGLFSLALQVIGLTYDNFRDIASRILGEPAVAAIEKGAEGLEKIYRLFQLARADVGALWEHIKENLAGFVDDLFEKVKQTIMYETIKKVLAYIATLFAPAGAFIKAAQAIYAAIRFLVDNIERIAALVNAFLDSVEMAVRGNVGGIAAKIIFGLQNAIVLGIDFLAKLLGLGSLADKARAIIKQLRGPVERAMAFVVNKVVKPVVDLVMKAGKALAGAGRKAAGKVKEKVSAVFEWWKKKTRVGQGGNAHTLYFKGGEDKAALYVESTPRILRDYLAGLRTNPDFAGADQAKIMDRIEKKIDDMDVLQDELHKARDRGHVNVEAAKAQALDKAFDYVGKQLGQLFAGDDYGTEADPIPLDWPGPRSDDYPALYFGGRLPTSSRPKRQSSMKAIKSRGQNDETGTEITEYKPSKCAKLAGGAVIGLADPFFIRLGRVVGPLSQETTEGGEKLLKLIGPYGFNSTDDGMELDHVHEIQFGGLAKNDKVENLWPLESAKNSRKGSTLGKAEVEYPRGHVINIPTLKRIQNDDVKKKKKFFFKVKSVE